MITDSGEFGAVSYELSYLVVPSHLLSFEPDIEHEVEMKVRIVNYVMQFDLFRFTRVFNYNTDTFSVFNYDLRVTDFNYFAVGRFEVVEAI